MMAQHGTENLDTDSRIALNLHGGGEETRGNVSREKAESHGIDKGHIDEDEALRVSPCAWSRQVGMRISCTTFTECVSSTK
ncbi:hypothetical protein DPMN_066418 [Dreissena polymorpha]|uniref:Uncharacterized protein n=1 Tax=Dreissena polymorpha TaxID=45954 RepID=A0A9D3YTF9_DREPO|nr:hypothetical protein DPMN_066418 [Dreissena polymorpha]